jgi:predicted transport protein
MKHEKFTQDELFENYWEPLQSLFRSTGSENTFDEFMRHFLTLRKKELLPRSDIYSLFRRYVEGQEFGNTTSEQLLKELLQYARHYAAITDLPGAGPVPPALRKALGDHLSLQANVVLPFLLEIHHDFSQERIDEQSYIDVLRVIETFLTRRFVCELPTNQLRKIFFEVLGRLEKTAVADALTQYLIKGTRGARMPRDDEFRNALLTRNIYAGRRWAWLILKRLELHQNGEPPDFLKLSIEHVMPQKLSDAWKQSLGADAENLHAKWLHTIGNLTLTGYNQEYSNKTFLEKRDLPDIGLAASGLQLNADFTTLDVWDVDSIGTRADRLAGLAVKTWPIPVTRDSGAHRPVYSLEGFSNLNVPTILELYALLDTHIRALHPAISQHFLKRSIQYKMRKSVCDVIPYKSYLRVVINMRVADICDPIGLTRDISGIGHWGNGDVEARLQRASDIDDVIALISQALEKQLQYK